MINAPLLYFGLCFLLGISSQVLFHPAYLLILALLCHVRPFIHLMIFAIGFAFAALTITLPSLPEEGVTYRGTFTPESVSRGSSPFGSSYITRGTLDSIPCQIYTPLHKPRPPADHAFLVEGKLLPKTFPNYVLKPTHIEPLLSTFSLAEWRFQIKEWTRYQFTKLFPSPSTRSLLLSMVTGDIDDRLMSLQFNRLGLLHLLGISGFQFSLLALLLGAALRSLLPGTKGVVVLILLLSAYAFILGNSPPIQRAWVGVTLYALARLFGLQISPLNALGAALIWVLLLDPLVFFQLGFQFSFLCTAAIFIVYPVIRDLFKRWLPGRSYAEIRALSPLDRIGHTFTFFCRETIALNLAIHLVSLPLIFFHFHKFPILSLAYNLFLPQAVSLAYLFLIPGLLLEPIAHFLAAPFLKVSGFITDTMIKVASNPPTVFDFQLRVPDFTLSWALVTLTVIMVLFYKRGRILN